MESRYGSSLDWLGDVGLRVVGLKDELDANAEAFNRLFDQARAVKFDVSSYRGPYNAQLLGDLNRTLDDIFKFEKQVSQETAARRVASMQAHREQLQRYREEMVDAQLRYQGDILLRQREEPDSNQQYKKPSMPIPIDQLRPILPKYVELYVGRDEELNVLTSVLLEDSRHVVILGAGGMGKTELAAQAMYRPSVESRFGHMRFFIDCEGVISCQGLVTALASVFGLTDRRDGRTLEGFLLSHIVLISKSARMLIVLDNLESAWDGDEQTAVEAFLTRLCRLELICVVATMRGTSPPLGPSWHRRITLKPLNAQESYTLFTHFCPDLSSLSHDHALRELLALLDGLPLAIELLATVGLTGYTPTDLLSAYREERTAFATRGLGNSRSLSLDLSIKVSMHCRTMRGSPEALKLLELLALLPEGLHDKDRIDVFPTMTRYLSTARVLVQVALCSRTEGVCRVLTPIRDYLQAQHPPSGPHLDELRRYHIRLALRCKDLNKDPLVVREELGPRIGNVQAVLGHAIGTTADAKDVLQALLALSSFSYITRKGDCKPYLMKAISTYQTIATPSAGPKSRVPSASPPPDTSGAPSWWKMTFSSRTLPTQTLPSKQPSAQPYAVRSLVAECKVRLGQLRLLQTDREGAIVYLKEARSDFEVLGYPRGVAWCKQSLGEIMWMQGDYPGSTAALKEAKAMFENVGSHLGAAQCTRSLGEIMFVKGDYEGAMAALKEASGVFLDLQSHRGVAYCTRSLGEITRRLGDPIGAEATLKEAKTMFEDVGDCLGAAHCARSIARINLEELRDYASAAIAYEEARAIFEDSGDTVNALTCANALTRLSKYRVSEILPADEDSENVAGAVDLIGLRESGGQRAGDGSLVFVAGTNPLSSRRYDDHLPVIAGPEDGSTTGNTFSIVPFPQKGGSRSPKSRKVFGPSTPYPR